MPSITSTPPERHWPVPKRTRKRSAPDFGFDHDHDGDDADAATGSLPPPAKVARTSSGDFGALCSAHPAVVSSQATTMSDAASDVSVESSCCCAGTASDMCSAPSSLSFSTDDDTATLDYNDDGGEAVTTTHAYVNDDDDGGVDHRDEEELDMAWIQDLRSERLDMAMAIANESLTLRSDGTASSDYDRRFAREVCDLCRRPLVFAVNNEAMACATEGCSPHVYNICDSTLASIAFGEMVDFTDSVTKQSAVGSRVCEEEIYGTKNKQYTPQDVIDYLRVSIVVSLKKTKSSEITANDIRAACKALGWTDLYPQGTQILCRMTGRKYPQVSEHVQAKSISYFNQLKDAHQGVRMKNCLFFWYKIYEMMKQYHILPFIRLVEKKPLATLDASWKTMCEALGWPYVPTTPREKCVINPVDLKTLALPASRKEKTNVLEMSMEQLVAATAM